MINEPVIKFYPELNIDVDMVLRGQGADPGKMRERKPRLVDLAEQAVLEGKQLIQPVAMYTILPVDDIGLKHFSLAGQVWSTSSFVTQHLAGAQQMALLICTLGAELEKRINAIGQENPAYSFALDSFGSVAAKTLRIVVCEELGTDVRAKNLYTSIPLIPGMNDWPVDIGQPQIFAVLNAARIGVSLNESAQMIPRKSISMLVGIGQLPFNAIPSFTEN